MSEQRSAALNDAQRELVDAMQQAALNDMEERPVSGLAELRLADYFRELFRLRNRRNDAVARGDLDHAKTLNAAVDDLLRDLKRMGVPYHPAFGNRDEWRRLDASDLATRDYDWDRRGEQDA